MTAAQVEMLALSWDHGRVDDTPKGERLRRTGIPSPSFWPQWRHPWKRKAILKAGVSAAKGDEGWTLTWSTTVPEGWKPATHAPGEGEAPPGPSRDDLWVRQERERILREAPPINETGLLAWQPDAVKILVNALEVHGAVLDASDPGIGKTYASLAAVREFEGWRPAIICPKAIIPAWVRVCEHIGVDPLFCLNYDRVRNGRTGHGEWLGNPKKGAPFRWDLPESTMLIFDEGHQCKTLESRAGRMLIAAVEGRIPTMVLSATIATSPVDLGAIGRLLGLHKGTDFQAWLLKQGCMNDGYGMVYRGGPIGMVKLHREIFPHRGNRVRIEDLGDLFPETLISAEAYDTSDTEAINAVYDEMHEELEHLERKEEADEENVLTVLLRARQRAELLKVPMLADMAIDWKEEGLHVPMFLQFTESLLALAERLDTGCLVYGGNKKDERQRNIDRFQADEEWVILCNAQAGGIGISMHDTHGRFPRGALICPGYSAVQLRQCLGRVHRAKGMSKSIQRIVFAAGTIEDQACRAVQRKLDNLAGLNDGDLKSGIRLKP